jgi:AI-2 transport protein TqsA
MTTKTSTEPLQRSQWRNPNTLRTLATILLVVALSFWLLDKLAVVLRPLLLAVLVAYVILPYHNRLRRFVPPAVSIALIAGFGVVVLGVIGFVVYASIGELRSDLPNLRGRAERMVNGVTGWVTDHAPRLMHSISDGKAAPGGELAEKSQQFVLIILTSAPGAVVEVLTAGLYLLFLLLGAGQLRRRVEGAYDPARAERILDVFGQINSAIVSYLRAKVQSSLLLAVASGVVLAACGVRFALLWAVLTFLCNFIPYVGSVVAYCVPIGFAAVSADLDWWFVAAAGLLLATQILSATIVEPMILGKAVGLSPLVILAALALWGSIWGLPGMLMAVPLTVVILIVLDHFEASRPVAKLLEGS